MTDAIIDKAAKAAEKAALVSFFFIFLFYFSSIIFSI
jgi:hypothetical protein